MSTNCIHLASDLHLGAPSSTPSVERERAFIQWMRDAADGSGFEFIADCLIDIDKRNPQLAARMALPLTRMGAYNDARRHQMRQVLERMQTAVQSTDLGEVIEKALA